MKSEIKKKLDKNFAERRLRNSSVDLSVLKHYKTYAKTFADIHNGIAVLSDLTANWSYTYIGKLAERLYLPENDKKIEINSIWEDFLLERVYPEDLAVKHALELQFLNLVKKIDTADRFNYQANSVLRVEGREGQIMQLSHQIFYLDTPGPEFPQLALCCYTVLPEIETSINLRNYILNQVTGVVYHLEGYGAKTSISTREKEILSCIKEGMISKRIAEKLGLSINTVNRHRQNILQKLRVRNSYEAVSVFNKIQQDHTEQI
ncbi:MULTISPECIES: helix-turn-helix transcriptional regulator [unclassified Sphingobacterium]|uniref:helix-turn-helix domain-containing protein n=1 Tax=unclassified Sphingobacterium TaxID=2609468 RepID=UPI001AE3938F|nr:MULTISPECIES: LuxR family transcriptional regulator [unclassified Sphingobacterium]MDR6736136.1 DNA-binding CsgD family transcriptional regulator [Sphingobacterium sp. 2149]